MLPPATETPLTSPFRAWGVVGLLCVVAGLNYLDRNMITTMRPSLVAAIPMTDAQFALLLSVFLWVYAVASPFTGFLADRLDRGRVIVASLFIWSIMTWLTAHAKTYEQLLWARALMGLSEACYIPAALALIADYHGPRTLSLATGIHMVGITVGAGFGGIGGYLSERHTWNFPFTVFGAVGMVYAVLLFFVLKEPKYPVGGESARGSAAASTEERVGFFDAMKRLFSERAYVLVLCYFGLLGVLGWGFVGWLPTYFYERFDLKQGAAGFSATGYLSAAGFCGVLIGGWWADRWCRTNARARILVPFIGLVVAGSGVLLLALTHQFAVAVTAIVMYGVGRNFTDSNMMPILCLIVDRRYRATGYGILNFAACMVGGVGNYAAGALRDAKVDFNSMFFGMVGCAAVCAVLLYSVRPKSIEALEVRRNS